MQEYGVKDHCTSIFAMVIVAMAMVTMVGMVGVVLSLVTFFVFE